MATIQDVIDYLVEPAAPIKSTVDMLKFGDPKTEVRGIATTFMATHYVLQQAAALGVNLLITHEGIFYSHLDQTEPLQHDPVYLDKRKLIQKSGIAIYRFHDSLHRYQPDGIAAGLVRALGWQSYVVKDLPSSTILTVPSMTVEEIAKYAKRKMAIPFLRVVGNLSMTCRRIGLLVGYRGGGSSAIPLFESENLDLIMAGEGPEWETPEYVQDAVCQGKQRAFILLGHAESEKPGMRDLANLIKTKFRDIPVHFISEKPFFQVI